MMDLVKGVSDVQQAALGAQIGSAVQAKVLESTSALQSDLIDQLLGKSGIGQNLSIVA